MSETNPKDQPSLLERFPNMRPLKRTPGLMTLNGIGVRLCGQRDWDESTRAHVKTHCFTFLYIPLLALGAYRVVEAENGGWYFLGKEPLSRFARTWNWAMALVASVLLAAIGVNSYTSSPEYLAKEELKRAAQCLSEGKPLAAAESYRRVATGKVLAEEGRQGLQKSLELCLQNDSAKMVEGAFTMLSGMPPGLHPTAALVPDPFQRGLTLVDKFRSKSADDALNILGAVARLQPTNAAVTALKIDLLKQIVAATPGNTNRVIELAVVYESNDQLGEAARILEPHRQHLGATEGARILGQHLLREGGHAAAYDLLHPYVQRRLAHLHSLERVYTNAIAGVYQRALDDLQKGRADRAFYGEYERASKTEKDALVEKYIERRMRSDATYQRAVAQLKEANQIVTVTLDLGIVQVNRAQGFSDPAARKAELEAAEKTFLAIRGFAGETDEYRMFLGQVYYWLGRSTEGRELFDQLLAAKQRPPMLLTALAEKLREVGEHSQARELSEEAYKKSNNNKEKYAAAALRAHTSRDYDDKIAWLERADPTDSATQIALNNARGEKALEMGNKDQAAQFLRKAIAGYDNLPKNSTVLNNQGLAYLDLYEVTGNPTDHNRGLALLEQAIALEPGNSIMLINITQILVSRAVMDVARDVIRLDLVKEMTGPEVLSCLYNNAAEREDVYARLRANESMKRALVYLDKSLLLAPKTRSLYQQQLFFQSGFRDHAELQKLQQRLAAAQLDLAELQRETGEYYSGAKDQENLQRYQTAIQKFEQLQQSPALGQSPRTRDYLSATLDNLRQNAALCGAAVDSQAMLETARASYEQRPGAATRGAFIAALFFRANEELARENPEYRVLAESCRRSLGPRHLIAFVLEQGGPLAEVARRNPSVTKALQLEKELNAQFPGFPTSDDWALAKSVNPAEATRISVTLKTNAVARLAEDLRFQLAPMAASTVLEHYWMLKLLGDEPHATDAYAEGVRRGIPLPALPGSSVAARPAGTAASQKLAERQ